MKKPVKIGLWLLGFAVLALLGLWLEHERGKARLAAFKAQLIAKGEKLAIADHVPKLPNALSNAAPDFIAAASRLTELKWDWQVRQMRMVAPGRARVAWQQAELPTDKDPDLWPILTAHVEENRHLLTKISAALGLPELVFNVDYSKGFDLPDQDRNQMDLPVHTIVTAVAVDLRADRSTTAISNLLTAIRLFRLHDEPLEFSQWVRMSCGHLLQHATWEALQHPHLTDAQLLGLQAEWQAASMGRGWVALMEMKRAFGSDLFEKCRNSPDMMSMVNWSGHGARGPSTTPFFEEIWNNPIRAAERASRFGITFVWALWFSSDDEILALRQHQHSLDAAREAVKSDAFAPAHRRMAAASISVDGWPPTAMLSSITTGSLARTTERLAMLETYRRLTFTAIALHRHRLKHGKFPESLGVLVPGFLTEVPRDFMDGQPLRYKLQADGQFLLWSVGEDFKDGGGDTTAVVVPTSDPFAMHCGRDWVWPQPASKSEVQRYHDSLRTKK